MAWTVERCAGGYQWGALSRALGIPAKTLQRWTMTRTERPLSLRPVDVIDDPAVRTVTIVSPSGLRIEGVTIADAIAILRGLA